MSFLLSSVVASDHSSGGLVAPVTWDVFLVEDDGIEFVLVQEGSSLRGFESSPGDLVRCLRAMAEDGRRPGLPDRLRGDAEVLARARGLEAHGVELVAGPSRPELVQLATQLAAIQVPGLPTRRREAWVAVVRGLVQHRPWRHLEDSVGFHLAGPPVDGRVAVVLGLAGVQRGIALYGSEEERRAHRRGELSLPPRVVLLAALEPESGLPPHVVGPARDLGLAHGGFVLQLMGVMLGTALPLAAEGSEDLLVACQCVLAAWQAAGPGVRAAPPLQVQTTLGPLTVGCRPAAPALMPARVPRPPLARHDHQLAAATWEGEQALVIKQAKADAKRLASRMADADRLTWRAVPGGIEVSVWAGRLLLGSLPPIGVGWKMFRAPGRGRVLVMAGGAKRQTMYVRDILLDRPVEIEPE